MTCMKREFQCESFEFGLHIKPDWSIESSGKEAYERGIYWREENKQTYIFSHSLSLPRNGTDEMCKEMRINDGSTDSICAMILRQWIHCYWLDSGLCI